MVKKLLINLNKKIKLINKVLIDHILVYFEKVMAGKKEPIINLDYLDSLKFINKLSYIIKP